MVNAMMTMVAAWIASFVEIVDAIFHAELTDE